MIGNEPNQPRFWLPQFSPDGKPLAAAQFLPVLAASYDALKAVDPTINVIGVGLSPRGNDQPFAKSNVSRSPVRFLHDLGVAYRASGRTKPLMDELAFHPYPQPQQGPPSTRYAWPTAGLANLDRIKQAVWDAFHGTAQPTFAEAGTAQAKPLRFDLDEVGWQVAPLPALASLYTGVETPGTKLISEDDQATYYRDTVTLAECDPAVRMLSFFHLVDETDLDRWQSGLERADGSHRPSYDAVKQTLAQTHGNCPTTPVAWRHLTAVVLPTAAWGSLKPQPLKRSRWSFGAGAGEEADFKAGLFKAGPSKTVLGKRLAAGRPKPLLLARGVIKASTRLVSVSAAPAQARPLRLCDPDDRDHEPEPRERPRQPTVPGRRPQMTDPRVARLGELVVNYSLGLEPGKVLRIDAPPVAAPLAVEVYRAALAAGAHPYVDLAARAAARAAARRGQRRAARLRLADRQGRDRARRRDRDDLVGVEHPRADACRPGAAPAAARVRRSELAKRRWQRMSDGELGWLGVLFPTEAHAQDAQMSLAEYERFVFRACHVEEPGDAVAHWQAVRAELGARAEGLSEARELRIVGPGTDLTLGVEGRRWQAADGRYNMPDGEVYTSPLETVTEGEISFVFPALFHGREVADIRLRFEGGARRRGGGLARARVPRRDARDRRRRAAARRGRVRPQLRDRPLHAEHALRREDRRDDARRARLGLPGPRRAERVRPALGPRLRPARGRRGLRRRRARLARRPLPRDRRPSACLSACGASPRCSSATRAGCSRAT